MSQKLIIGLAGQRGSGKGTVAKYLKDKYKVDIRKFSQPLSKILDILKLPNTRENLQDVAMTLRRPFGQGVLVLPLKKFIQQSAHKIVVVDGLRTWEEVEMLRSFRNNFLVYIEAPAEIRFERLKQSGEKTREGMSGFKEFLRLDKRETELLISKIGKKADVVIKNTGTIADLHKKIDESLKERIRKF